MQWMKDRRVRIGVGIVVVFLAVKWFFTATLSDAYLAYTYKPEDGDVAADPLTLWAMAGPFIDIALAILAAIGAQVLGLVEWLWQQGTNQQEPQPVQAVSPSSSPSIDIDSLQLELARAAASNEGGRLIELAHKIRKPYAIADLVSAIEANDWDAAKLLFSELLDMPQAVSEMPTDA